MYRSFEGKVMQVLIMAKPLGDPKAHWGKWYDREKVYRAEDQVVGDNIQELVEG